MSWIPGALIFAVVLTVVALVLDIPIVAMVRLVRHRATPRVSRVILAATLAVTAGWLNWRAEWFDVGRFGPPAR